MQIPRTACLPRTRVLEAARAAGAPPGFLQQVQFSPEDTVGEIQGRLQARLAALRAEEQVYRRGGLAMLAVAALAAAAGTLAGFGPPTLATASVCGASALALAWRSEQASRSARPVEEFSNRLSLYATAAAMQGIN